MNKRRLGKSGIVVSEISLGTMTFASSCDEKEAFRIMDFAVDNGVDFFDTAELYPVPPKKEYVHQTEEIIGRWLKTKSRDSIILASKVAGPGHGWFRPPVREGLTSLDRHHITRAIEGSLRRLNTDYIDLYQTHWPDPRHLYEETLNVLDDLIREGKVRIAGSSNETAYGMTKSLCTSDSLGIARYETIQNNYSILNRRFEDELATLSRLEEVSLLAYSPLAGGVSTGKYNSGKPENARFSRYQKDDGERQRRMASRFLNEKTLAATARLMEIAKDIDLSAAVLSLAWSKQNDFTASTIVGANTVDQLAETIMAADVVLDSETMKRIDEVSLEFLYPMG